MQQVKIVNTKTCTVLVLTVLTCMYQQKNMLFLAFFKKLEHFNSGTAIAQ